MSEPDPGDGLASHISEVLFTAQQIAARVQALGAELAADYRGKDPLFVGVLTGSFQFVADLVRAIDLPLEVDFMAVSSYGQGSTSSGAIRIVKDLDRSIEGRHVLVVEDIVDSGRTLAYLIDRLTTQRPASIEICALLDKQSARQVPVQVRYSGFRCRDAFVVGYGLDYAGRYRNLPYIGVLSREHIDR